MNRHDRLKDALRALCAQSHDDDAPEPRRDTPRPGRSRHADSEFTEDSDGSNTQAQRKTHALAGQIREVLDHALRMSVHDPALARVDIAHVELSVDGRAIVTVVAHDSSVPAERVRARLSTVSGLLRAEVARVIARKRVPTLHFVVAPADPARADEKGETPDE